MDQCGRNIGTRKNLRKLKRHCPLRNGTRNGCKRQHPKKARSLNENGGVCGNTTGFLIFIMLFNLTIPLSSKRKRPIIAPLPPGDFFTRVRMIPLILSYSMRLKIGSSSLNFGERLWNSINTGNPNR